jgi:hypothetical protein
LESVCFVPLDKLFQVSLVVRGLLGNEQARLAGAVEDLTITPSPVDAYPFACQVNLAIVVFLLAILLGDE